MNILEKGKQLEEEMIKERRFLHRNPEISGKEEKTVAYIIKRLEEIGVEYVEVMNGGVLGFINFDTYSNEDKTVLLRADIDALPIKEETKNLQQEKVAVSEKEGCMHACGHDGHTAMLLAATKIIMDEKELFDGRIIIMFERGEEGTHNFQEIYKYIEKENIRIDTCYGVHLFAGLETRKIAVTDGPIMAGINSYEVTIKGKGGHSSRPDESVNPIYAFNTISENLQDIRMEKLSPFNTFTHAICQVRAGSAANIIPETVTFTGSTRFYDEKDGDLFLHHLKKTLTYATSLHDCKIDNTKLLSKSIPVVNDPVCASMARNAFKDTFGDEIEIIDELVWMASESMGFHLALWPGVFAFIGIENEEKGIGAPHHNPKFDLDEDMLVYGAASMVAYAKSFFASEIDTSKSPNRWDKGIQSLLTYANDKELTFF